MKNLNQQQKAKAQMHLFIACTVLFVLAIGYIYFLSVSVVEVIARKEIDSKIVALHSDISELESDYIDKQHSVSSEIAMRKGFVEAPKKTFIDKGDSTLVLSGNVGF